jgi:hypothetical protein
MQKYGARFRQKFTPEDARRRSLEVSMRVTNVILLGCPLPLTVTTVNSVQTLKAERIGGIDFGVRLLVFDPKQNNSSGCY